MLRLSLILIFGLAIAQLANTSDVDSHGHASINKTLNTKLNIKLNSKKTASNKVFVSEEDIAQEITQAFKKGRKIDKQLIENYNKALGTCDIDYKCTTKN